jgi:hypothetical protein
MNRAFACNSNLGNQVLLGSFAASQDIRQVSGNEVTVDFGFAGSGVPSWWQFKTAGSCRPTSLNYVITAPASVVNCPDWSAGQAVGGLATYTLASFGPNSARLLGVSAVPQAALADLQAGQEYFSFQLTINNLRTVGTGACGGCDLGGCIALKSIKLTTPIAADNVTLFYGAGPDLSSGLATWQGGTGVITPGDGGPPRCLAATPVRNSSWNRVKALYR